MKTLVGIVILFAGAGSALAGALDDALDVSGARRQIAAIPTLIREQVAQRRAETKKPPSESELQLFNYVVEQITEDAIYKQVRAAMISGTNEKFLQEVIAWYSKPVGKKIVTAENELNKPGADKALALFLQELQVRKPSHGRLTLIERVDEVSQASTRGIENNVGMVRALMVGANANLPAEKQAKLEEIEAHVASFRKELEAPVKVQTQLVFLYAYRNLSDAELESYVKFMESTAGRSFLKAFYGGLQKALTKTWGDVGASIGRSVASQAKNKK